MRSDLNIQFVWSEPWAARTVTEMPHRGTMRAVETQAIVVLELSKGISGALRMTKLQQQHERTINSKLLLQPSCMTYRMATLTIPQMKAEHFGSSMLNAAGKNRRYNSWQLASTSLASHSSRQEDRGVSYTNAQAAAETLVNLRSRAMVSWSHGDADTWRRTDDPAVKEQYGFQNFDRAVYSRPIDSGTAACQGNATMSQNVNPSSTAILYSDQTYRLP